MIVTGYSGRVFEHVSVAGLKIKSRKEIDENTKGEIFKQINFKMMCGKRLSHEEKEFLKQHFPDTYEKAIRIEKEREEYRKALRSCKTKEAALHFHIVTAMRPNMEVEKQAALFDEFNEFAQSREYIDLPNEFESKRKVKDKKSKFTNFELKKPETERILFSTYDRNSKLVASFTKLSLSR